MEYKPKVKRKGINPQFGYYVSPIDPNIMLPDKDVLDALEYSFRMRAKYNTPIRDCTMWLHAQTGQRITPPGYLYSYRRWLNKLKSEKKKDIKKKREELRKEKDEFIQNTFGHLAINTDDREAISALAYAELRKAKA